MHIRNGPFMGWGNVIGYLNIEGINITKKKELTFTDLKKNTCVLIISDMWQG